MSTFELPLIPSKLYTINRIFQQQQWDHYYAIQLAFIQPTFWTVDIEIEMSPTLRPRARPTNENPHQFLKRVTTGHILPTWKRQSQCHTTSKGFQNIRLEEFCYRNSVVQALLHLPKFVNWVEHSHRICTGDRSLCIPCAMRVLSRRYWYEPGSPRDIDSGMRKLTRCMSRTQGFYRWNWYRQQDASEFLLHLVNAMPEENQTVRPIVEALFEFDKTQTLTCPNCRAKSSQTNPEKILGVSLQNPGPLSKLLRNNVFARETRLGWRCQNCQHVATAERVQSLELVTTPEILVVQLLRFDPLTHAKDNVRIPFSQSLNLTHYTSNRTPARYRLMAVVHHSGTLHQGHYVAVVLGPGGKWQKMDDNLVTNVKVTEALNPRDFTPYLLFYAKMASG